MFYHHRGAQRDPDFERWPKFTPKSETYAVGRIAHWIYDGDLSLEYYNKQHKLTKKREEMTRSASQQRIKPSNVVWISYIETIQSKEPP
jgi:hypothetical protein